MPSISEVRPSPLAGTWYPAQPQQLASDVDRYMEQAGPIKTTGKMIGVIAPHAGHRYSGPVAGYGFAAARGLTPSLVAIIGPMHHPYVAPLITTAHTAYQTPLGSIPVDSASVEQLSSKLKERLGYGLTSISQDPEHSLEIELPFLQRALPNPFQLLPVMVRVQEPHVSQVLGECLAETLRGQNALIVASTDLSHFHNQETASQLDAAMLEPIAAFDPARAFAIEQSGQGEACGIGALTAVLWCCKALGADSVRILHHATSGDVTGDFSRVVGYAAGIITQGTNHEIA